MYNSVKSTGVLQDDKIRFQSLRNAQSSLVLKNINKATEVRAQEKNRIAKVEEERMLQNARNAEEEKQKSLTLPLTTFQGSVLSGLNSAYFRTLPHPILQEVKKSSSGSKFDDIDNGKWDSKYMVDKIIIAPGVTMNFNIENYDSEGRSKWSWTIITAGSEDDVT